jgi:hypothetical protein
MSQGLDPRSGRPDGRLHLTDHYVFDAQGATVLVMNVATSPVGGRGWERFDPRARYEFKIHLDGDEREAVTYRWVFQPELGDEQSYRVERLTANDACSDRAVGTVIARGRTGEHVVTTDGGQAWAGTAVETFFLDVRQLHDVDRLVQRGEEVDLTRWAPGLAEDSFGGAAVLSIVLTVRVGVDGLSTGRRIGTWAATKVATERTGWRQVTRAALPMMWRIFRPTGSEDPGHPHQTHPADDPASFGPEIAGSLSSAVGVLRTSERPEGYADSVVERVLPDLLTYVVGSPAVFGFGRFNGRRLADNAAEVMFSLVTNAAVPTGLRAIGVRRSQETFPFVLPTGAERLDGDSA